MDQESTGGMVILREQLVHERGIHWKTGYTAGNYQLRDKESTEGKGFAGNYQLIDKESAQGMGFTNYCTSSRVLIQTIKIKMRENSSE
jgi:hypothetical protein